MHTITPGITRLLVFVLCPLVIGLMLNGCGAVSTTPPDQAEVIVEDSESASLYTKAQQQFDAGHYEEAIALWEQIPPSAPQYLDAQLGVRNARLQIEKITEEETESFESSSEFDEYISQAEQLERAGDVPEALKLYEEARQLEPQNILLHDKIEELHEILDDSVERHKALGELYFSRGEYEKARAEWEGLLEIEPENELAKQRLADLEVFTATSDRVFFQRGRSLVQKGLLHEAKAEFEKALRVNPSNERTLSYLSKLDAVPYTEYSVKKGDTLSSIAEQYTQNAYDYIILADFNGLTEDEPLSIGQIINIPHILGFKKALAPEEEDVLMESGGPVVDVTDGRGLESESGAMTEELQHIFEQGIRAYNDGDYRKAATLFNQIYEQDPDNLEAYRYFLRAIASMQRGEPVEEDSRAEASVEERVDELIQKGQTYREAGQFHEALTAFEDAAEIDPGNPTAIQQLEETRDELQKAITAHLNEGIKLFNQEELEEAILEWDKVLELDPSHQQAAEYRKRAEQMLEVLKATTPE